LKFAKMIGADLSNANLMLADLAGADLTGATVAGADFNQADVTSAKLVQLINGNKARNLANAKNIDRAVRD
jgi:uncharacterized protein YjbI with pentapeptide repeats